MEKVSTKPSAKEIVLEFASDSTVHGLRHIFYDSSKRRRSIWLFVFVAATVVNFIILKKCFVRFFSYPTTTEMNEEFAGSNGLPFPAVSICPTAVFMKSKIKMEDTKPEFYQLGLNISACQRTASIRGNRSCGDFLKCGVLSKNVPQCKNIFTKLHQHFGNKNAAAKNRFDNEFRDRYGPDLQSMLLKCVYNGQEGCSTVNFTKTITLHGKCFTFNSEGTLGVTNIGYMSGLYVVLDSKLSDSIWNGYIDGIKVHIHQPKREVEYWNGGTVAPVGKKTKINLQMARVNYLPDPYKAKCRTKPLPGNRPYSSEACMNDCFGNQLIERCGCHSTGFRGSTTAPVCLYSDFDCLKGQVFKPRKMCPCPPACEMTKYRSSVSTYGFSIHDNQEGFLHLPNSSINWSDLVIINVGYQSLTYNMVQQKSAYDVEDFVGELGGNMGFFLGCSILTLIEFLEMKFRVITTFLCSKISKAKRVADSKTDGSK